jgi:hypothetical protein
MERKPEEISPELLASRIKTNIQMKDFREFLKTVDPDILKFRKKVSENDIVDIIPSILGDIQEGFSPIIVVCGKQQKGKTRFAVTLANLCSVFLYYKYFTNQEKYFVFQPEDILKNMSDYGHEIFILDESGATGSGINKFEWYSKVNKLVDYLFQTQSNLKNIFIFTLPFFSDLTLDVRKYVEYVFEAGKLKKDYRNRKGELVRGYSEFKCFKMFKKYSQMKKEAKGFRQVWIENLIVKSTDLPLNIWQPIDERVNKFKIKSRSDKLDEFLNMYSNKNDWWGN